MIYLDNAATSFPKPEPVYKAVDECLRGYSANPGRSGHKLSLKAGRQVLEARQELGELFNIKDIGRIIFTMNATDSLNLGLKGFLTRGDHVITTSMEHNSVLRPLKALEKAGVEASIIECDETGALNTDELYREIRDNTALIVISHASNVSGTMLPIEKIGEIARSKNIAFMVDAAQTAGIYDIDVEKYNIDMLAFTGHKGLYGPQGVGGLYIDERINLNTLREGGTGSSSESLYQPEILPDRYESGTPNTPGIAGLHAGVSFIKELGIHNIRAHEEKLCGYFIDQLQKINKVKIYGPKDVSKQAAVISINIGDMGSSEVSFILDDIYDIATRPGLHCAPLAHRTTNSFDQGTVRFSIGYFNTMEEMDMTLEAIKQIAKEL